MKLLYFAWFRTRIGMGTETLSPPADVKTVKELLDWLASRGPGYAAALAERSVVRVAVNQDYVGFNHPVAADDEVALFPPVTGG